MATAKPTFEEQLAQLQQIVNHLEQGECATRRSPSTVSRRNQAF